MPILKPYRSWWPERVLLLPPSLQDWLPEGHLAYFLLDVVEQLDITPITDGIQAKDPRGALPFDPRMMVVLLLYAYCTGRPSSRKIERATYEDVAFRVLADGQHPDHTTISDFRRVNIDVLVALFVQVLRLCQAAGLVKLGHVALDGTKGKANASRYKAMSYQRMLKTEKELEAEIQRLLAQAEADDREEDKRYGKDKREDELPDELRRRQDRLAAIRRAKAELEREAARTRAEELREQAERNRGREAEAASPGKAAAAARRAEQADARAAELEQRAAGTPAADPSEAPLATAVPAGPGSAGTEPIAPSESDGVETGSTPLAGEDTSGAEVAPAEKPPGGDEPQDAPSGPSAARELPRHRVQATAEGLPNPKAQRNFTDPESQILKKGKDFLQGYNCQAAVDEANQIIVAEALTNQPPDAEHLEPMLDRVQENCGKAPEKASADAGYFSEANVEACQARDVDPYIAVRRQKDQERAEPVSGDVAAEAGVADKPTARENMDTKLRTPEGKAIYARRKAIVEPVFGQMRTTQGFHQFLLRGLDKARGEWSLYCTGHNLLKLFRAAARGVGMPWSRSQLDLIPAS
ncbi:MAG: IS1182 family transposase, partial [Myxococcota bacterium]|nr:IS1182 family transposase [Myxococcota bacterium]